MRNDTRDYLIGLTIYAVVLLGALYAASYMMGSGAANAAIKEIGEKTDDGTIHCQYPYRTTNPPGGCDNSDPCDPTRAGKSGDGECLPTTTHKAPQISLPTGDDGVRTADTAKGIK